MEGIWLNNSLCKRGEKEGKSWKRLKQGNQGKGGKISEIGGKKEGKREKLGLGKQGGKKREKGGKIKNRQTCRKKGEDENIGKKRE